MGAADPDEHGAPDGLDGLVDQVRAVADGDVSPVELVERAIERIERIDPVVRAVVTLDAEGALRQARTAERVVRSGRRLGLLHGVPIGVKDLERTAGLRTTFGSPLFADHVPDADDRTVAALRAAGAIVLAKTNLSEFAMGAVTRNPVHGATGNPFDPALTCGGSSGGSAVGVATGMFAAATGTDNGGSLRNPASMCGVVGFRPSPGTVPSDATAIGWSPMGVTGPIARTVRDAALVLAAQVGHDPGAPCDPMSVPGDPGSFGSLPDVDLATVRVAWSEDLGFAAVDPGIRRTFRDRIDRLDRRVASCDRGHPDLGDVERTYTTLRAEAVLTPAFQQRMRASADALGPRVREDLERASRVSMTDFVAARVAQTDAFRRAARWFDDVDVLLTPTVPVAPFPWTEWFPASIEGRVSTSYVDWLSLTYAISMVGLPAASVPCGVGPTGLAFGIQVVGAPRADVRTLAIAAALERAWAGDPVTSRPVPDLASVSGRGSSGPASP